MGSTRLAITGANGYLGTMLTNELSTRGYHVIALTRRPLQHGRTWWRHFDLGQPVNGPDLEDVDVLIHAAWVLRGRDEGALWRENVEGSRKLIDAATAAGVGRIVFISSMSAYFGTQQSYGLMKLAVERTVLDIGGVVIRPGLVYGDAPGGMAATLQRISQMPLWPRFRSAQLFLAHEADIAPAIALVLDAYGELGGQVIGFAHPQPVELSTILTGFSPDHRGRPCVPVPAAAVMAGLRLLEHANVDLPFRSDSLLGLVRSAQSLPGRDLLTQQGIKFRGFGE
jgi:nucleoside-diphosphate-sugar epimerase